MVEQDTIRLLRECDAGVRMGVATIEGVVEKTQSQSLRRLLAESRSRHEALGAEVQKLLERYRDEGKPPSPMATGMSWLKTNAMLQMKPGDRTVADLMTDGCNMGVKSLHRYLNQYRAADEASRDVAKKLINLEQELAVEIRGYL